MNTYLIEHRIRTLATIWNHEPFVHGGYEFRQWEFWPGGRPAGEAWIAKRQLCETSWLEAINRFRADLFAIADRIAVASQCYTMASAESFLILRKTENPERTFFLRYSRVREPVPLPFRKESIETLDKLDALGDKLHALHYLREATSSTTFLTRLVMLLATLEALAGEIPARGNRRMTDTEFIRTNILKDDDLFNRLYVSGSRLRHAIVHGHQVNLAEDVRQGIDYISQVYAAIVNFLNNRYDLNIDTAVIAPQRTPYGNYEMNDGWLKPCDENEKLELRSIYERLAPTGSHPGYPYQIPKGLRYVDPPEDY